MIEILTIAIAIISVIILPAIGFMFKLNSRIIQVEDKVDTTLKLYDTLFKKLDELNKNVTEIGKEVHYLVKIDKK